MRYKTERHDGGVVGGTSVVIIFHLEPCRSASQEEGKNIVQSDGHDCSLQIHKSQISL